MLEEAKKRGIVEGLTNLFDEYWSNPETADARQLPYLEGDYWIGEAENIIKVGIDHQIIELNVSGSLVG